MTPRRSIPAAELLALLVVIVAAPLFARVVRFEFIPYWDDNLNVVQNPLLHPVNRDHLVQIWRAPYGELYIPVAYTTWAALAAMSGDKLNASTFHVANFAAHVIAALIAYCLLLQLLNRTITEPTSRWQRPSAAAAGALLFAIHPLQVEAVAWVSGLRDVLGGMFGLAALWLFVLAGEGRRRWLAYAGATLAFLLALGSKPGMVCLPAVALLLGWRYGRRFLLTTLLPWLVIGALWAWCTGKAQPSADLARGLVPVGTRPWVAADALSFYLAKLFYPWPLCAEYGRAPNVALASGQLYWTWLLPAGMALVLALWRRARPWLLPLGIFAVALAPTLGLVPFNFQFVSTVADRYAYFAMIGPALALAWLAMRVRAVWIVLPALGISTASQLGVWANTEHLFEATLRVNPGSWKAHHNYGNALDDRGDHQGGIDHITKALTIYPGNAEGCNDLGACYAANGQITQATEALRRSFQIRATANTARNLALLLLQTGAPVEAATVYREAVARDPSDLALAQSLAWLLAAHPDDRARNGTEARQLAERIIRSRQNPSGVEQLTLAAALAECGEFGAAAAAARKAEQAFRAAGDVNQAKMISERLLPAIERGVKLRDEQLLHPLRK